MGTMKAIVITLVTLTLLVLSTNALVAATLCVNPTGTGGCYSTIQAAIAAAATGDTINVMPGIYSECVDVNKKVFLAGMSHENTSILCASGDAVTFAEGSSGASILRFTMEAPTGHGVLCNIDNLAFTINNCVIQDCGKDGIHTDGAPGPVSILNCVIRANSSHGLYLWNGYYSIFVYGNIIDSNLYCGLWVGDGAGTVHEYNCYYANQAGSHCNGASPGPGEISLPPRFADSLNGDFHLQADSPCRNSGKPGGVFLDCDGTRNDMGVYGGPNAYCGPGPVVTQLQLVPATVVKGETFKIQAKGAAR